MEIIHIVLGKANPNRMNGVNKVVYQMAVKQAEMQIKVSVWGITADLTKNFEERNFETQLFLKSKNPFTISAELKKALLSKKENTIFHIHGGWIPVFYSISKVLHSNQINFVFTPHGAYNTIAMKRNFLIKKLYFQLFEKTVLKNSKKIHNIGKSESTGLSTFYKNNKSVLLPYGFENTIKPELFTPKNEDIVFGFIGRLDIYTKGLDTLLLAFEKVITQFPNAKLWIIGDSNEKSKLETLIIKYKLSENVILFGSQFGEEKNNLLKKMDVFVHPSRNEGLPTSVIEAASFGKPCVVSNATNINELIESYNAGKSITKQDSNELHDVLIEMILIWQNKKEYETMSKNAIKLVEESFNWKKVITDLNHKLYEI
jgi:glycosyltransferase involved in cell wall biosynthesis